MKKAKFSHLKEYEQLEELWQKTYKARRKKVNKKKAIISANAKVYAEALKNFNKKPLPIKIKKIINEKVEDYKKYNVGNNTVYISTKEKLLKDFPMAERKGRFKNMDDAFEREIFSKLIDEYDLTLDPDLYYVINGDK